MVGLKIEVNWLKKSNWYFGGLNIQFLNSLSIYRLTSVCTRTLSYLTNIQYLSLIKNRKLIVLVWPLCWLNLSGSIDVLGGAGARVVVVIMILNGFWYISVPGDAWVLAVAILPLAAIAMVAYSLLWAFASQITSLVVTALSVSIQSIEPVLAVSKIGLAPVTPIEPPILCILVVSVLLAPLGAAWLLGDSWALVVS